MSKCDCHFQKIREKKNPSNKTMTKSIRELLKLESALSHSILFNSIDMSHAKFKRKPFSCRAKSEEKKNNSRNNQYVSGS